MWAISEEETRLFWLNGFGDTLQKTILYGKLEICHKEQIWANGKQVDSKPASKDSNCSPWKNICKTRTFSEENIRFNLGDGKKNQILGGRLGLHKASKYCFLLYLLSCKLQISPSSELLVYLK